MRIAVTIPSLHGGGAEHVLRAWISQTVAEFGWEWHAFTYGEDLDDTVAAGVPVERHSHRRVDSPLRHADFIRWLGNQSRRVKPDLNLGMLTYSNLALLAASASLGSAPPVVISERNVPTLYMPLEGRSGRIQLRLARSSYRFARSGLAISHAAATDMVSFGMAPDSVRVVPNPTLPEVYPVERPAKSDGSRDLRVLFVGRLVEQKRPLLFVETLVALRQRGWSVSGAVVGSGPLGGVMADAATRCGVALEFLGWLEDWRAEARASDVLLLPSSVEGFGNVFVEAAQAGLPSVAASEALGVADAIVPGVTGELAHGTASELARAVERAAQLDLRTRAVASWLERFTVRSSARALRGLFEDTL